MRDSLDNIDPSQVNSLFHELNKNVSHLEPAIHDLWKYYSIQAPGPLAPHQMEKINSEYSEIVEKLDETILKSSRLLSLLLLKQEKPETEDYLIISKSNNENINYFNIYHELKDKIDHNILNIFIDQINDFNLSIFEIYNNLINNQLNLEFFLIPFEKIMISDVTLHKPRLLLFRCLILFKIFEIKNFEDPLLNDLFNLILECLLNSLPLFILFNFNHKNIINEIFNNLNLLFSNKFSLTLKKLLNYFKIDPINFLNSSQFNLKFFENEIEKNNQISLIIPPPCLVRRSPNNLIKKK